MGLTEWIKEQISGNQTPLVKSKNLEDFIQLLSIGEHSEKDISIMAKPYAIKRTIPRLKGGDSVRYFCGSNYTGVVEDKRRIILDEDYGNLVNKFFNSNGDSQETLHKVRLASFMTADNGLSEIESKFPTMSKALLIGEDNGVLDRSLLHELAEIYNVRPFPILSK